MIKKYIISVEFKTKLQFLKAFNELYKNGIGSYIEVNKYSYGMDIKGITFHILRVKETLNILRKLKYKYISLKIIKTEYENMKDEEIFKGFLK